MNNYEQDSVSIKQSVNRRSFLKQGLGCATAVATGAALSNNSQANFPKGGGKKVQTVLGDIDPQKLGATLMHEHAPIVDWSELYETAPAPVKPIRKQMIARTAAMLDKFHDSLTEGQGPGAVVECTPIRVGRYPYLLADIAKKTKVHLIACTGFWCEALAPQHPWAVRMSVAKNGIKQMAGLYIKEISTGMEDPRGEWGEKFTDIKAGIIKIGTSKHLRPSEKAVHVAAAIASKETGCPITTHTTDGGGFEEAVLLLKHGAKPEKVIIGHQGNMDDRENSEAPEYHRQIASLGCYVQFDRVDHKKYECDKQARLIKALLNSGFEKQILLSHDHAPYYYPEFTAEKKSAEKWMALDPDYTTCTTKLVSELKKLDVTDAQIQTILVENPKRVLAF